jgi:DNA-binding CsgD family transcriptional regulator
MGGAPVYREFGCQVDLAVHYAAEGDFDRARALLRANDGPLSAGEKLYRDSLAALIGIASGRDGDALPAVPRERQAASPENIIERRYFDDAGYCLALAYWARGRRAPAARALPHGTALGRRGKLILAVVGELVRLPHPVPNEAVVEACCNRLEPHGLGAIGRLFYRVATRDKAQAELSRAEIALLTAFATSGGRTADVARALGKSPHTVRNQMRSVFGKIGCSSRNEAIAYARQRGWLHE